MDDRTDDTNAPSQVGRRGFLRIGGFTVAGAALLAACGEENQGVGPQGITQAGTTPPSAAPPSGVVTDSTLLRTSTALHYNVMDVVDAALAMNIDPDVAAAAEEYRALLEQQAGVLAEATVAAGGEPFEQKNPVFDARVVQPALALIDVSQTPEADAELLVHAMATLLSSTLQGQVPDLTQPALRATVAGSSAVHAQAATVFARIISPDNVVPASEVAVAAPELVATTTTVDTGLPTTVAATETTAAASAGPADIPIYQVPSAFGSLAPVQIVLGDATQIEGDQKRTVVNIETPSLNSYVYDDA